MNLEAEKKYKFNYIDQISDNHLWYTGTTVITVGEKQTATNKGRKWEQWGDYH